MSMLVKVKKIKFEDQDLFAVVDMKTIEAYKENTGDSFIKAIQKLKDLDDIVILNLIGACLRESPEGDPVGKEFINKYNPISLLMELTPVIVELLESSLPKDNTPGKKKQVRTKI